MNDCCDSKSAICGSGEEESFIGSGCGEDSALEPDDEDEDDEEDADSKGGILETTANGVDGGEEKTVVNESSC